MNNNFSYLRQWTFRLLSFALMGAALFGLWYFVSCLSALVLVIISAVISSFIGVLAVVYTIKEKDNSLLMMFLFWFVATSLVGWGLGLDNLAYLGLVENLTSVTGHILIYPILGSCFLLALVLFAMGVLLTCEDYDPWWKNLLDVVINVSIVGLTVWGMHALFPII